MEMISPEEARQLIIDNVDALSTETVPLLEAAGRIAAEDLRSDIDVSPFAHSAMDGFALYVADIEHATEGAPVELKVVGEIPAGAWFEGTVNHGECVRIMTGAPVPAGLEAVVKYEIVGIVEGDGKTDSIVSFTAPADMGSNIRAAGEEAKAGEVFVHQGEQLSTAGIGFVAGCGYLEVPVYKRPRVGIIAIGSELVNPTEVPTPGLIRNSNSYALAACAQAAGAVPTILPIVIDDEDLLAEAVLNATKEFDFIVTSGGASNGDYDFIKPVVERLGKLLMTNVNMRPGKAQTFGIVNDTPVFGLPGNPAAAYLGFELLIRPALRKMQGYTTFEHPIIKARLAGDKKKRDPRRFYMRAILTKNEEGVLEVQPAKNQSSGLFGIIQKTNCLAIFPENQTFIEAGSEIDCIVLDIDENIVL